jgi:hypothetical protein
MKFLALITIVLSLVGCDVSHIEASHSCTSDNKHVVTTESGKRFEEYNLTANAKKLLDEKHKCQK